MRKGVVRGVGVVEVGGGMVGGSAVGMVVLEDEGVECVVSGLTSVVMIGGWMDGFDCA